MRFGKLVWIESLVFLVHPFSLGFYSSNMPQNALHSLLFNSMLFEFSSVVRLFNILIMFLSEKSLIKLLPKPPSHFSFQVTVESKQWPLQIQPFFMQHLLHLSFPVSTFFQIADIQLLKTSYSCNIAKGNCIMGASVNIFREAFTFGIFLSLMLIT